MSDQSQEVPLGQMPPDARRVRYQDTFSCFSEAELQGLTEVKRFVECYEGDRKFRQAADAGAFTDEQRALMKDIGITFEPEDIAILWQRPEIMQQVVTQSAFLDTFEALPAEVLDALRPYPLAWNWAKWRFRRSRSMIKQKKLVLKTPTASPAYTAWRARRMNATRSELGFFGWELDHPCHAIEMAVGCTVQCGFCAFDAQKLQTTFDYNDPDNRALFRSVARGMANQLGWPAGHGMLYWSTEPHDNPHYVDFLREWESMTGAALCTATARADEEWVSKLLDYYRRLPAPWPRISVLGRKIMYRLHKRFSPMELRDLTMLMQQSDAEDMRAKVPGGRERMLKQLVEADDMRDIDPDNPPEGFNVPQGSIACVSGFLINLVQKTIKLISPCYTTLQYRYGYRVYDEDTFQGPEDFEEVLRKIITRSMVEAPYAEMPMRFRDDLKFVPRADGFRVVSPTSKHDFCSNAAHKAAGELIQRGDLTYGEVFDKLVDEHGVSPLTASILLRTLFDKGYLDEMAVCADWRARQIAKAPELGPALAGAPVEAVGA